MVRGIVLFREPPEAIRSRRRVLHPKAKSECRVRRIELGDRLVQIGQPPFATREQLAHEAIGMRHALAHDRFPQRHRGIAARRTHTAVAHAQAVTERGERRRVVGVNAGERGGVVDEERQRLIVQGGKPVAEERRLSIGENADTRSAGATRRSKDRIAPDRSGQRNRDEVDGRVRCGRPAACSPIGLRRPQTAHERIGRLHDGCRARCKDTRELCDEARAIRRRRDAGRLCTTAAVPPTSGTSSDTTTAAAAGI